jgi:hypothetical protein
MRTTLLSLAAMISGCTVGTFGVRHPAIAGDDGEVAAPSGDDDAAPARGGKLACTPDHAGTTFASAVPLGKGVHAGCIVNGKVAIYSITAPDNAGGTLYDFHLAATEQICVQIFDKERVQAGGGAECISGAERGHFWAAVAAGSTIYVGLEPSLGKSPFELEVAETLLDDPEEPNNSWKQATRLALGTEHQALLQMVLNDKKVGADFYQVKVGASGDLAIALDPGSDDVTAEVAVFDADRQEIAKEHAENPGAVTRQHLRVAPGTYYVVVGEWSPQAEPYGFDSSPTSHFAKPYSLSVSMDHEKKGKKQRISKR